MFSSIFRKFSQKFPCGSFRISLGINFWFHGRVQTSQDAALLVALAYLSILFYHFPSPNELRIGAHTTSEYAMCSVPPCLCSRCSLC